MGVLKKLIMLLAAALLPLAAFYFLFESWKIDFHQPLFGYKEDGLFNLFLIKNIVVGGWFSSSEFIGWPHLDGIFNLSDFPLHGESSSFALIKFLTLFSDDVFFITNCFFLITFALISAASFVVLRHFKISNFSAILISILYAFLPYHFERNEWHLLLSNYATIPFYLMIALWIVEDKIELIAINKKNQFCLQPNRYFFLTLLTLVLCLGFGLYYAFYGVVIMFFAWVLRSLKKGSFVDCGSFSAMALCLIALTIILLFHLPLFLHILQHGFNPSVAGRTTDQSEKFGLKIVNLLLPVSNHYLDVFRELRANFDSFAKERETTAESLGLLGSAGFLFSILWIISKCETGEKSFFQKTLKGFFIDKKDRDLISNLSNLNLLSVLFATVGGFVMLLAIAFPAFRSHARFCVFIAFISFFLVAIIFDKIIQKNLGRQKIYAQICLFLIFILALFDQVGVVLADTIQSKKVKTDFLRDKNFIAEIENSLPQNSAIFVLPNFGFPEASKDNYQNLICYIHSSKLRWSYPAIAGRKADLWQQQVVKLDFKSFVAELKKAGFVGVYIDRKRYANKYDWQKLRSIEKDLKSVSAPTAMIADDLSAVFYRFTF